MARLSVESSLLDWNIASNSLISERLFFFFFFLLIFGIQYLTSKSITVSLSTSTRCSQIPVSPSLAKRPNLHKCIPSLSPPSPHSSCSLCLPRPRGPFGVPKSGHLSSSNPITGATCSTSQSATAKASTGTPIRATTSSSTTATSTTKKCTR